MLERSLSLDAWAHQQSSSRYPPDRPSPIADEGQDADGKNVVASYAVIGV